MKLKPGMKFLPNMAYCRAFICVGEVLLQILTDLMKKFHSRFVRHFSKYQADKIQTPHFTSTTAKVVVSVQRNYQTMEENRKRCRIHSNIKTGAQFIPLKKQVSKRDQLLTFPQ